MPVDLRTRRYDTEDPRLQRHVVHDPRSLDYVAPMEIDQTQWRSVSHAIYQPRPNPNQVIGNCTAVSQAVMFNTRSNRRRGVVLDMDWADRLYHRETELDPFRGVYPPDDTGSNGLAGCKASQESGDGETYYWQTSIEQVVQLVVKGWSVSVGTRWDNRMFTQDSSGVIHPGGLVAGGHQYTYIGWNNRLRQLKGRCWWGDFKDFWIAMDDAAELLADDGDSHVQVRAGATG